MLKEDQANIGENERCFDYEEGNRYDFERAD